MINVTIDLRSKLHAVRDQGSRNTCLAHAVSTAHELCISSPEHLSPEYLHYFSTNGDIQSGSSIDGARTALREAGQPSEQDCPYGSSNGHTTWRPPTGLTVYQKGSQQQSEDIDIIESAINSGKVLGLALPDSFFTPKQPWIISSEGKIRGMHAVAAVGTGTNSVGRLILIRNSWGPTWGDQGYAWLDENFLSQNLKALLLLDDNKVAA